MIYGRNYATAISNMIPYHLSPLLDIASIGSLPFSGSQKKILFVTNQILNVTVCSSYSVVLFSQLKLLLIQSIDVVLLGFAVACQSSA
jgi:hypothetical protein